MCQLCDNRFFDSDEVCRVETYEVWGNFESALVLPSWDCYDDSPDELRIIVNFCPECGKDLSEEEKE
ncbi:hypothetical protein NVP1084O_142 [Vibrio phage 1.084.O._10N.261.49.F5]|nr:hypothetical protein NVP1084O_142 [Vibrio phage 1.084.O._10N.261.49.F5]